MTVTRDVRAVFFDIGGPLYDDADFVSAVLAALDEIRGERGLRAADRARFLRVYEDLRRSQDTSLRGRLAAEFLGGPEERDLLRERTRAYWRYPRGTLHIDVLPCLRALHGKVRIGVLADRESPVVDALARDGAADLVDVWAVSAPAATDEPDPDLLAWALRESEVAADQAVHIGNRLDTDIRPARALGLGTIWVLRGEAPADPTPEQLAEADAAVTDLTSVPDLVFRLPLREVRTPS